MSKNKIDNTTNTNKIESNPQKEEFSIQLNSKLDPNTTLTTQLPTTSELSQKWLQTAMYNFNNNQHQYSAYLKESSISSSVVSDEELVTLAINPQSDLTKVKRINDIARYYMNSDDLIGKVYETIESNVNTEFKLSYKDLATNVSKGKVLDRAKDIIDNFNEQINLKGLLRKCVPLTYSEGNYPLYLRKNKTNDNYVVDYYPLGVVEVSDYEMDGEPYLILNINELKSRLLKVNKKTKNGTALFFKDVEEEIKNNYPPEVYQAYMAKEQYVKLDIKNSGILRINNMNRKYGVTPIFRTFKPAGILNTFEETDRVNAQSIGKKIILQTMRKELLGDSGTESSFEELAYSHQALMAAWQAGTAGSVMLYTSPSYVESVAYVEPKVEGIDIDSVYYYRSKVLTNLGISFLSNDSKNSFATANISIKELMKMINKITEQLEEIIKKWYKALLQDNNIDLIYCPNIKIIDSEMLEMDIRIQLVETLYSKMNCSLETAYSLLNLDIEDEKQKRVKENLDGLETIFAPRLTAYTNNGDATMPDTKTTKDKTGGRPTTKDTTKKDKSLQEQNKRGTL